MPQENIMANARLQTRKKIQGPKIFFCCFNFCSFFLFQKSCNFIYILYFFIAWRWETFFLNFSLEFLSKIFCLYFLFRIDETTEGIFSC